MIMEGILDGNSPRRGSLSSLHRQPSHSFSNGTKFTPQTTNISNLYKDLDKFTRYFIIKTVQVIVQSRISGGNRIKTECKPNGNDWFNINIADIAEVSDLTKAAVDVEGFSIRSNWRVNCEISLKTNDGERMILEHWIISNRSRSSFSQNQSSLKANQIQSSTKNHLPIRPISTQLSSASNNGNDSQSTMSASSATRVRHPAISRTRLNSIDDCSDGNIAKDELTNTNGYFDIKSSASCYSLSTTNQVTATTLAASSSTNSLNNNPELTDGSIDGGSTQGTKSSATSSIYTIYNRMSLLLKTLMTTAHIVPAYRLASRTSQTDPCVICYRVYTSPHPYQNFKTNNSSSKSSTEDTSCNSNPGSPNKCLPFRSPSFGSIDLRDYVEPNELDLFCPLLKLGSIKTEVNELTVSLCYRTDVKSSNHLFRSPKVIEVYNKILDEDCITAAKRLLAGNELRSETSPTRNSAEDEVHGGDLIKDDALSNLNQPLKPAFASKPKKHDNDANDSDLEIVEMAFEGLLQVTDYSSDSDKANCGTNEKDNNENKVPLNGHDKSPSEQSEPIQVPIRANNVEYCHNGSSSSTPKSLTDSFVFVDLNPPFASEEQNDLNSFFHGPSPVFGNGFDNLKDVDEVTNQLAVIEANAHQLDEFVDNICISEDEEEDRSE